MIVSFVNTVTGALHKLARFTGTGRTGEKFEDRPMMQHYGFGSRPKAGAQALVLQKGQMLVVIADDDSRYRIALEDGEVAIYDDLGSKVHLKRGGVIEVKAPTKVIIDSPQIFVGDETSAGVGGGIVTGACVCSYTGALHPVASTTVKAKL